MITRRETILGATGLLCFVKANSAKAANRDVAYGQDAIPVGIRSRFLDNINGLRMHVLEAGFEDEKRPCVLLLHGVPELAYVWTKVMLPIASAGYHVIAPDLRGYGRTTGWDSNYDCDLSTFSKLNYVRDMLGLVSALGKRKISCVVGRDAGSAWAGWCSILRPDVFQSVVMMTAPFPGPPTLPLGGLHDSGAVSTAGLGIDADLAALVPPRKYYRSYYRTREAAGNLLNCSLGLRPFFRGYFYYKSASWKDNKPFPLKAQTAQEMAKMPRYYVMDLDKGMCETVASHLPTAAETAAAKWLTDQDIDVLATEYARTGFQGTLNNYRVEADPKLNAELQLFSGRTIDVPACFIGGNSDWGVYQTAGALDKMKNTVCTRMEGVQFVEGAGHWVQQEQPAQVSTLLIQFLKQAQLHR